MQSCLQELASAVRMYNRVTGKRGTLGRQDWHAGSWAHSSNKAGALLMRHL